MENQYQDFEDFLENIDMVVIMVKHSELRDKMDKLSDKIVLDCCNVCNLAGTFKL